MVIASWQSNNVIPEDSKTLSEINDELNLISPELSKRYITA
jgi:hypothetical protein